MVLPYTTSEVPRVLRLDNVYFLRDYSSCIHGPEYPEDLIKYIYATSNLFLLVPSYRDIRTLFQHFLRV